MNREVLDMAFERFSNACGDLGLPAWRVDTVRREWWAPDGDELHAIASCERMISAVVAAAAANSETDRPYVIHPWLDGIRILLVREQLRLERFGWVATLLAEPGSAASLAELCEVPPQDAERALSGALAVAADSSEQLAGLLARVHREAVEAIENDSALDDFTTQLTIAYESSVLMGGVARSMNRVDDPLGFLNLAVGELYAALPFGWVSLFRSSGSGLDGELPETPIKSFDQKRFDGEQIDAAARIVLEQFGSSDALSIEPCPFDMDEALGPELVIQPILINGKTRAFLALGARAGAEWAVSSYDTLPISSVAASISVFLEIVVAYRHQQESFMGTLRGLSRALDAKDAYTRGHSDRVAHLGEQLAKAAGLAPEIVHQVRIAGMVHDIGKIGVPEAVLQGNRKLTDEEFAQIRLHPGIGFDILQGIPMLAEALPGVLYHHERWDGRGYPEGLAGEAIPLIARVLGIADAFDAMSSNRKYQSGQERQKVLAEIASCRGTHFDAELADLFVGLDFSEYDRMLASEAGQEDAQGRAA